MRKVYLVLASLAWFYTMPMAFAYDLDRYSQLAKDGKVSVQRDAEHPETYQVVSKRFDASTGAALPDHAEAVYPDQIAQQITALTQQIDALTLRRDELAKLKADLEALPQ